jgi:hypothetical protein
LQIFFTFASLSKNKKRYAGGKLDDKNNDFYQWSGEYEVYKDYQEEIKMLR